MDASPSLGSFWKVFLLKTEFFDSIGRSKTGLWLCLRLFVLAGLVASIGLVANGLAEAGQVTFSEQLSTAASSLTVASGTLQQWTPQLAAAMTTLADRMQAAAAAIASVQPPLGTQPSAALRAIGAWASQPFLALAAWMSALLPVLLAARLMGGRGSLRLQVSLALLAFLPQALAFPLSFDLDPDTTAGVALALRAIAGAWGLAILIVALSAANGFSRGQAAKVLLVTAVVLAALTGLTGWLLDRLAGPLLSLL
jgi:hypothetical protein